MTDLDRTWTRRVTDVRQWSLFSASERWREDDREYEHYADSAGKSGGQKEKLAYTILAASLAYQFKVDWGAARSKARDRAHWTTEEKPTRRPLAYLTEHERSLSNDLERGHLWPWCPIGTRTGALLPTSSRPLAVA